MPYSEIGLLASLIASIAYLLYAKSIVWGNTVPTRSTWFLLTLITAYGAITNISIEGGDSNVVFLLVYAVSSGVIFLLAIKYGKGGTESRDKLAFVGFAVAVVVYLITDDPLWSLLIFFSLDFWALLPTILSARESPEHEELTPWVSTVFASALAILAVNPVFASFEAFATPIYLTIVNGLVLFYIVKPYFRKI